MASALTPYTPTTGTSMTRLPDAISSITLPKTEHSKAKTVTVSVAR